MRARLFFLLLLWGLGLFASTARVQAHPQLQNSMWVLTEPERLQLALNVSVRELAVAQGLAARPDGTYKPEALEKAAQQHAAYLRAHLAIKAGEQSLAGELSKVTAPLPDLPLERSFYLFEFVYPLQGAKGPLSFSQTMLREFPYAPGEAWEVSYLLRLKRSGASEIETALLSSGAGLTFALEAPGLAAAHLGNATLFRQYLVEGVVHILTGYDHLLFVSALVLATLTFWEMIKVIAAFTLAHTLTLTFSALDWFRLPSGFVEPVIAASIVFVALENVFWPNRIHSRMRLLVAFGFGLVHGLGFAGGLLDVMEGLPALHLGLAIFAFSLGVELGHQLVVLPLFGLLRLGHCKWERAFRPAALRYGSIAISLCGLYYFIHAVA